MIKENNHNCTHVKHFNKTSTASYRALKNRLVHKALSEVKLKMIFPPVHTFLCQQIKAHTFFGCTIPSYYAQQKLFCSWAVPRKKTKYNFKAGFNRHAFLVWWREWVGGVGGGCVCIRIKLSHSGPRSAVTCRSNDNFTCNQFSSVLDCI